MNFEDVYGAARENLTDNWAGPIKSQEKKLKASTKSFSAKFINTTGKDLIVAVCVPQGINLDWLAHVHDGTSLVCILPGGGKLDPATLSDAEKQAIFKINPTMLEGVDAVAGNGLVNGAVYKETSVVDDGKALKVIPKGKSYEHFLGYIRQNPAVLKSIVITANDQSFFGGEMKVSQFDPFDNNGSRTISFSDFFSENQQNDKRITIDPVKGYNTIVQLDDQTLMTMTMPGVVNGTPLSEVTVQFNFGAVKNIAEEELTEWQNTIQ